MSTEIQETIARLRELDRVTAPAPWRDTTDENNPDMPCLLLDSNGGLVAEGEDDWGSHWFHIDNMVPLLIELRNTLPDLLSEIDRLTAENKNLTAAWEGGYKAAAHTYYEGFSEPDDFAQEARVHSPYQENKK